MVDEQQKLLNAVYESVVRDARADLASDLRELAERFKVIRRSMRLLPERYRIVTATCDRAAGEIGTIYQACGFDDVGTMRAGGRALNVALK